MTIQGVPKNVINTRSWELGVPKNVIKYQELVFFAPDQTKPKNCQAQVQVQVGWRSGEGQEGQRN